MSLASDTIRDAVNRYFAAWSSLDPVAYTACFSDDAVVHDPYGSTPRQGTKALREFFGGIAAALEEVRLEAEAVHVAANRAAVVFRGKAIGKIASRSRWSGSMSSSSTTPGVLQHCGPTGTALRSSPSYVSDHPDPASH
jgi:steroid delta-isomerase